MALEWLRSGLESCVEEDGLLVELQPGPRMCVWGGRGRTYSGAFSKEEGRGEGGGRGERGERRGGREHSYGGAFSKGEGRGGRGGPWVVWD